MPDTTDENTADATQIAGEQAAEIHAGDGLEEVESVDADEGVARSGEGVEKAFAEIADEEGKASAQEMIDELEERCGDVSELFVDLKLDEDVDEFFLEALPRVREVLDRRNGKTQFCVHREPNDDLYLILGLKPTDFKT